MRPKAGRDLFALRHRSPTRRLKLQLLDRLSIREETYFILKKKQIGRMIPCPVIENGRKVINLGPNRCSVCRSAVRRYRDTGYGWEVLERLLVVGGLRRLADECPVCHSSSQERLVWLWRSRSGSGFRLR